MKPGTSKLMRFAGAALLLGVTLTLVRPAAVLERLSELRFRWLLVGVALSVPTYLLLALRWWQVANRIGARLGYQRSLADYYLGGFVNQALPTGLAGSALKVVRHARRQGTKGRPVGYHKAVSAVLLDRISGLAGLAAFALAGAVALSRENPLLGLVGGGAVLALLLVAALAFSVGARRGPNGEAFVEDAREALLRRGALAHHVFISSACVILLSAGFYCAAQAAHVEISFVRTLSVAPLVLGSMVIPLSVAGWGVREAAAAALFSALGVDAATGVAVSVTFGLMSLVASAPGMLILLAPDPEVSASAEQRASASDVA